MNTRLKQLMICIQMTVGSDMKKAILVMLLALALALACVFTGCGSTADNTDSPATATAQDDKDGVTEEPVTGGNGSETENSASSKVNGRTPVTPVENGGNINKS